MIVRRMLGEIKATYNRYPSQFWILVVSIFVDRLGGALLFPFFTLYITSKFGVGMTDVGLVFGAFSVSSLFGSTVGGALADRLGRKGTLIFGLLSSAASGLLLGFADSMQFFVVLALFAGLFESSGRPAGQAMIADLLPEEQRAEGFGVVRIAVNLAVTIGPAIGGLLATRSYLLLFIADAVTSFLTAGIVALALQETKTALSAEEGEQTLLQTFRGYGQVLKDTTFMIFLGLSTLVVLVYMQMNTTLGVYLRDFHGVSEPRYGYILSLNAAMVVLFQFAITRRFRRFPDMLVLVLGTFLYAVGFSMYGYVSTYALFLWAMVVITIGEMLSIPVQSALVARFSPADKRGRYMAVFGYSWILPFAVGAFLAGIVMDNSDPRYVWYAAGVLGLLATAGFYALYLQDRRLNPEAAPVKVEADSVSLD